MTSLCRVLPLLQTVPSRTGARAGTGLSASAALKAAGGERWLLPGARHQGPHPGFEGSEQHSAPPTLQQEPQGSTPALPRPPSCPHNSVFLPLPLSRCRQDSVPGAIDGQRPSDLAGVWSRSGKPGAGCLTEGGQPAMCGPHGCPRACRDLPRPLLTSATTKSPARLSRIQPSHLAGRRAAPAPTGHHHLRAPCLAHLTTESPAEARRAGHPPGATGGGPPGWGCPPGMTPASWGGAPGLPRGDASTNVCASFQGLMFGLWRTSNSVLLDLTWPSAPEGWW